MRLLFDQNLSFRLCDDLNDIFSGSVHVRAAGLAQALDKDIWEYARHNGLTIVSQDSDFAELAVLRGAPPKVIWIRTGNRRAAAIAALLRSQVSTIYSFANDGDAACLEIY